MNCPFVLCYCHSTPLSINMLLFRLVIGLRISQVIFQQQGVRNHVKGINAINSSKNFDRNTITAVEAVAGRPMNALLPRTLNRGQMLSSLFITINLELFDKLLVFVMHLQNRVWRCIPGISKRACMRCFSNPSTTRS